MKEVVLDDCSGWCVMVIVGYVCTGDLRAVENLCFKALVFPSYPLLVLRSFISIYTTKG